MRVYCIDTSSFVNLRKWRPRTRHRATWERLEELISADRVIAPEAVFEELKRRDDELTRWAKEHRSMFKVHTHDHVRIVREILNDFPDLIDENQAGAEADPFVIALAYHEAHSALLREECIVVTEETYRPGRSKIPHVCQAYKLQYLNLHQMFMGEKQPF